jgi:hypothetical protein
MDEPSGNEKATILARSLHLTRRTSHKEYDLETLRISAPQDRRRFRQDLTLSVGTIRLNLAYAYSSFAYTLRISSGWMHRYSSVCRWVEWLKQTISSGSPVPKTTRWMKPNVFRRVCAP